MLWFEVGACDRQGFILSPTCFDIFLNHMMEESKTVDQVIEVNDKISLELKHADDTL